MFSQSWATMRSSLRASNMFMEGERGSQSQEGKSLRFLLRLSTKYQCICCLGSLYNSPDSRESPRYSKHLVPLAPELGSPEFPIVRHTDMGRCRVRGSNGNSDWSGRRRSILLSCRWQAREESKYSSKDQCDLKSYIVYQFLYYRRTLEARPTTWHQHSNEPSRCTRCAMDCSSTDHFRRSKEEN